MKKVVDCMMENLPNDKTEKTVVIVNPTTSLAVGICALIFAILGLFFFSIVFVPLSLILSVIAIIKKQLAWGISAIVIAGIAAWTSPTIWIALGIGSVLTR